MAAWQDVWTNRLVDSAKVDAITLNGWSLIDAVSIWAWVVNDTQYGYLNWVTSAVQTQINTKITSPSSPALGDILYYGGSAWEKLTWWAEWTFVKISGWVPVFWAWNEWPTLVDQPTVDDTKEKVSSDSVAADDPNQKIVETHADWSKTEYREDWIYVLDWDWEVIVKYDKTWTYDSILKRMDYLDWTVKNLTWQLITTDSKIAYLDKFNNFEELCTFSGPVSFLWGVTWKIEPITLATLTFTYDCSSYNVWKISMAANGNILFNKCTSWTVYTLFINTSAGSIVPMFKFTKIDTDWTTTAVTDCFWANSTKPDFSSIWTYVVTWIMAWNSLHLTAFGSWVVADTFYT